MTAVGGALLLAVVTLSDGVSSQNLRLNYYSNTSYSYGRLEINNSSQWIPFTINSFDMYEADLACRTLGYGFALQYATVGTLRYSEANTTYSVHNLVCSTTAISFSTCNYSISTSYPHYSDVGLRCTNSRSSLQLISSTGIAGGSSGRLQIYINNTWGTVCEDSFGWRLGGLACRQLGFPGYLTHDHAKTSYQQISYGPIWLDDLNYCNSSSMDLRKCTRAVGIHNCKHSEDIILTCYTYPTESPTDYAKDLRLVFNNSTNSYLAEGRLEIFYTNTMGQYTWLTFCIQGFTSRFADLACKQLGFRRASSFYTVESQGYNSYPSSSFISSMSCSTAKTDLRPCILFISSGGCLAEDYVALKCTQSAGISTSGIITSVVIGPVALVSCCCVGILMCVVVAAVSRKKSASRVRNTDVAKDHPHYNMSNITIKENVIEPTPAPPYTPCPIPPATQQLENTNPQTESSAFSSITPEKEKSDHV